MKLVQFIGLFFISVNLIGADLPERPLPHRYVNDIMGLLNEAEMNALEKKLQSYYDTTSTEITIIIQETINNEDIIAHSKAVFEKWGVGGIKNDNGILVSVAVKDKHMAIISGYGVESLVNDASKYRIRENYLKPSFRKRTYYKGLDESTNAIMMLLSGHYTTEDISTETRHSYVSIVIFGLAFIIFFVALPIWRYRSIRRAHMGGQMDLVTTFLLMNSLGGGTGKSFVDFSKGSGNFRTSLSGGGGGAAGSW